MLRGIAPPLPARIGGVTHVRGDVASPDTERLQMRTTFARLAVALLLVLPVTCTPAATAGGGRSDLITQEEIQSRHFQNAYEAVQALHANWLVTRGTDTSGTQVVVYEDLTRLGGVEALRGISTLAIKYIQHYNADEATARWGLGHGQGAIQVSTMPR